MMWQLVCFGSWIILSACPLLWLSETCYYCFGFNDCTAEVEVLKTEQPLPHDAGLGVQNLSLYCTQYTFIIYCLAQPTAINQKHV
jgi:hypothetical protein